MDYYDILLAKKLNGGGGSSVEVEPLSVTENGTYSESGKAYSPVNVNVPQGTTEIEPKDINFFDYDGTCLYAYTEDEWASVTELPANPSHDGLVAQGWNYTKKGIDSEVEDHGFCDIGQTYVKENGETEIDIELYDSYLSPYLSLTVNGTVNVDWGDNSTDTITGSSISTIINTPHTYSLSGKYTIKITVVSGEFGISGRVGTAQIRPILNNNVGTSIEDAVIYGRSVKEVRLGNIAEIDEYSFAGCAIEKINIPANIHDIKDGVFSNCFYLNHITVPNGSTLIGGAAFSGTSLKTISIPNTVTTVNGACFDATRIECLSFPSGLTTRGSLGSSCFYLKRINFPKNINTINGVGKTKKLQTVYIAEGAETIYASAFASCYSLAYVSVPKSDTTIDNYAFRYVRGIEYHFLKTTPPTLGTNVFQSINNNTKIYVPYSADHSVLNAYKTATNWSTYASNIVEESQ